MGDQHERASDRPPLEALSVRRVRALLSWLSPRAQLPATSIEQIPAAITEAVLEPSEDGSPPFVTFPDGKHIRLRVDTPCYCELGIERGFCQHRAAILIWLLWHRPDGRLLFERPLWQLQFDFLSRTPSPLSPNKPELRPRSDRRCLLRAAVFPTGGYERGFDLELRLVRANKRGDGWLKPIRCPTKVEALRDKARPTPAQERVVDLADQLAELVKIDTFARKAPRLRAGLAHQLLAALAQAQSEEDAANAGMPSLELSWGDLEINASADPWRPTLRLAPGPPGQLEARWVESVLDHWRLAPSIVLTSHRVLRPLADDIPASLLDRIRAEPVLLDTHDFAAFARTILANAIVPIEILEANALGATPIERREARLYLEERGEILRCTAKLAYELRDGRCLEFLIDDRSSLSFGEDLDLVRAVDWEDSRRKEFHARVSRQSSVELIGDEAWTFLSEGLEQLRERGWVTFGEASLERNRVASEPLRPHMRLGPSTDWFELEVDFIAEGQAGSEQQRLPPIEVIESWLAGQRFVRLADERVAALPTKWLERHGRVLAELLELGRDSHGRLGAHALPLASELLEALATADDDPEQLERASHWRARARTLAGFEGVGEREPPPDLQATLRDYQLRGYAWLCFLRDHGLGGCLADDMGLGKTVQAIALLLDTHARDAQARAGAPSLIVCPTSVIHAWLEQTARFAPTLRVHLHHGARRGEPPPDAEVDAIITSYALMRHDAQLWQARTIRHLILDEAQALKNPDSQLAQVARSLEAAHPIALTGTPLENHVSELWSLFEILMPGFFGSRRRFRSRWVDPIHKREDAATLARLRRRLRPFLLRRLKREVASELPPKQMQVLRCRLEPPQRALYERVRNTYRASVFGAVDMRGVGGATLHILEALTRLRQACCHPGLLPFPEAEAVANDPNTRVAKLEMLRLLLTQAIADGHRSLVFSQWPSFLNYVGAMLEEAGVAYLRLDGSTRDRGALLERWRAPSGAPVFLISTKAGGVGLDLTEADHVFHLDPWWNPATEDQATDRAHRIGQTRPVMVYKLVAADTVEDKILELQARKRRLFEATVDAERLSVDELSRADLEAVFAGGQSLPREAYESFELPPVTSDWAGEESAPRELAELSVLVPKTAAAPPQRADAGDADEGDKTNDQDQDQDQDQAGEIIELFPRRE